ncbi:MAG TPA: hypothetical protein VK463_19910 [Desulfomonilaceae bacterium]|nr:hypothetical protein [Desulfomonilaceae bacterium]
MDGQKNNPGDSEYNERFLEFIKLFDRIGKDERLFPKRCNTCGAEYHSFSEYLQGTTVLGHGLEDVKNVMHAPHTMQYRNCSCGSTLVLPLTADTYPELDRFWNMLQQEAGNTGRTLREVVSDFRDQCNRFILEQLLKEEDQHEESSE